MIAYPGMLADPCIKAGIDVPENPSNYNKNKYKRFHIFCILQLGRPLPRPTSHWNNAKIIAKIPEHRLKKITYNEILALGFE